jgi:hypothetical protein
LRDRKESSRVFSEPRVGLEEIKIVSDVIMSRISILVQN